MVISPLAYWNARGFNKCDKVHACHDLVVSNNLTFLCILEAKVQSSIILDPWFINSHMVFDNEARCNNFYFAPLVGFR